MVVRKPEGAHGHGTEITVPPPADAVKIVVTYTAERAANVSFTGTIEQLAVAFGSASPCFQHEMVAEICASAVATGNGPQDEKAANAHLAMVAAVGPADGVEGMLAMQMTAVHTATMRMAAKLATVKNPEAAESYERSMNRLARTFTTQVEALKRYRSKGDQKVTVEHVHVHAGGQAVVGSVTAGGGRGASKTGVQPHERDARLCIPEGAAVFGTFEADGLPVPGAGSDGLERLSLPRGGRRPAIRAVK